MNKKVEAIEKVFAAFRALGFAEGFADGVDAGLAGALPPIGAIRAAKAAVEADIAAMAALEEEEE